MIFLLPLLSAATTDADVRVTFSRDGNRAAVESRWMADGSGSPMVSLTELDTRSGATLGSWVSTPGYANTSAAEAAVWKDAQNAGAVVDIDVANAATGITCTDGACVVSGGCGSRTVAINVSAVPVAPMPEECIEFGRPETPMVTVDGKPWPVASPLAPCAHGYQTRALYVSGGHAVLLVDYVGRGHEGGRNGVLALAGSVK